MKVFGTTVLVAATLVALAGPAAASDRLTDTAYLQATRCQALATAAGVDASALAATLKAQRGGRDTYINDRARTISRDTSRQYSRAGAAQRERMTAELSGACGGYLSPPEMAASR